MTSVSPVRVKVSVLMPCYNEEKNLPRVVDSLADDYMMQNGEILVIDGNSEDKTVEVAKAFIDKGYPLVIVENKQRIQSHGLNLGIQAARGEFVVRVDAHSIYPKSYVKRMVELLETTGAANVGGVMLPVGETPVQQSIALAMQHPTGVGDARFHLGNFSGYVDTVYLGAFRKSIFEKVGMYEPSMATNEDAELNIRLLKAGEKIFLDSSIKVQYFPRESFKKFAVQYFKYGKGRAYTTLKHRRFTSFRQIVPPLFIIGLTGSIILGFFYPVFFLFGLLYLLGILGVSLSSWLGRNISLKLRLLTAWAFICMHISWGTGFLRNFLVLFFTPRFRGEGKK